MFWPSFMLPNLGAIAPGTEIQTVRGPVPVEMLSPGDWIETDGGASVMVRGVRSHLRRLSARGGWDKPVMIRAGALGGGLPHRDLVVAPRQRLFLAIPGGGDVPARDFAAPAAGLTELPGVRRMKGRRRSILFSLVLDRQCAVEAEGVQIECGRPGTGAVAMRLIRSLFRSAFPGPFAARSPVALSTGQTLALAPQLRADCDLPEVLVTPQRTDLLEWDRDLADEEQAAERRRRGAA